MKKKFKNKSVLIVDDDERNRYALSSYLDMLEMKVFTANDGESALNILRSGKPIDLVLLDIMMPIMDGYEMLRLLRSDVSLKDIPVIAVTARAMKGDDKKCLEAGATDYIPKPIDLKKFLSKMDKWL
jgi:two-component system, chemotaxis family, sensor kinase CheA